MIKTPIVQVAACLSGAVEGKVYHGLPLKIKTGYPIHINGPFQMHSSRTTINTDHKDNAVFLKYCMSDAYVNLLVALSRESMTDKYAHWPLSSNADSKFWQSGVESVCCTNT